MRQYEHPLSSEHEPNWEDREKFGPFGYQLPFMADVYAGGYELEQTARMHGDESINNPYHETPAGLYDGPMRSFSLDQVNAAARHFFTSPRIGHRIFAAEFLSAKQSRVVSILERPTIRPDDALVLSGDFDPDAELGAWLHALEQENSTPVLEEYWDFLGIVADDDRARTALPMELQVNDFEPLLGLVHARMMRALRNTRHY